MNERVRLKAATLWLAALHIGAAGAGFFAPADCTEQDRSAPLIPPTPIHFISPDGGFHMRPFVCAWTPRPGTRAYSEDCTQRFQIHFFVPGTPYHLARLFPSRIHLFGVSRPGAVRLMGTDDFGRDQYSRFLFGGQVSLSAGLLACAVCLALATVLGILAGYYSGWIDDVIMGASEISLALPWLYLLLSLRALLPLDAPPLTAFVITVVLLGLVGWARPARLIRGTVLSASTREYVVMSRGFGASDRHIFLTHILPQLRSLIATQGAVLIPRYILAEVVLSFLGLGVSEPDASWGTMLARAQHYSVLVSCWWMLLPGVLLVPIFLSFGSVARSMAPEA
jgi:peptide/nickel transport system permease protein